MGAPVSGGALVLVDKPAEHGHALDRACRPRELVRCHGDLEAEPAVRAGEVVVGDVGGQHPFEMAAVPDQDPVQALGTDAAYPSAPHRRLHEEPAPAS